MTPLQTIREAVVKAIPELVEKRERITVIDGKKERQTIDHIVRELTLADVLMAIEDHMRSKFETQSNADLLSNFQEGLWNVTKELLGKWNLAKSLDDQDEPTLKFLAEILK